MLLVRYVTGSGWMMLLLLVGVTKSSSDQQSVSATDTKGSKVPRSPSESSTDEINITRSQRLVSLGLADTSAAEKGMLM